MTDMNALQSIVPLVAATSIDPPKASAFLGTAFAVGDGLHLVKAAHNFKGVAPDAMLAAVLVQVPLVVLPIEIERIDEGLDIASARLIPEDHRLNPLALCSSQPAINSNVMTPEFSGTGEVEGEDGSKLDHARSDVPQGERAPVLHRDCLRAAADADA